MNDNDTIAAVMSEANRIAAGGRPVIVAIRIDYSKKTAFTLGAVKTNFGRFPLNEKLRFLTRAAVRHITG
jgi:acetolactate synthase I/II/III large subunit